jgi:hypothetical protein
MWKQFCTNKITRMSYMLLIFVVSQQDTANFKITDGSPLLHPILQAGKSDPLFRQQSERFGTQNSRIRCASSNSQDRQGYRDWDRLSFSAQALWPQRCPSCIRWGTQRITFCGFTQSLSPKVSNSLHSRNWSLVTTLIHRANHLCS